jgi:hypothetical protein
MDLSTRALQSEVSLDIHFFYLLFVFREFAVVVVDILGDFELLATFDFDGARHDGGSRLKAGLF